MNNKLLENAAFAYAALTCKTFKEYAEKHQYDLKTDSVQARQTYKKCKYYLSVFLELGFTEQDILVGFMDGEIISLIWKYFMIGVYKAVNPDL